jgi:hypothetical protein
MKWLVFLILCCFVSPVLYGQQTVNVPIAIIVDDQNPTSINLSNLKAEVRHQPATVMSITPLAGERLQYILLNDASGRNQWPNGTKQQTDAADQLLKQVGVASSGVGSLVNFSDQVYIDVQNENDPQKLAAKLERTGRGGTVMYEAVVSAAKWLGKQPALPDSRKVMFLFGDGEDNTSRSTLDDAGDALQRTGIPIFIVAPSSVETKKQGERLRQLASQSGGRVYFLQRDTRPVTFDSLKRDLDQSFLLKIAVPLAGGPEMVPVTITDVNDPRLHIIVQSQIVAPR